MCFKEWNELPDLMKTPEVRPYWEALSKKKGQLRLKRIFDVVVSLFLILFLAVPMGIVAIAIKLDSPGTILYRQERVTTYGKHFWIYKFRTMVSDADKIGAAVTIKDDSRITKVGQILRKCRLDELPQLFNIVEGTMSFVGTRPEAVKYVEMYEKEYIATLLLPAGITSEASIRYKDESRLLDAVDNVDEVYMKEILPMKMKWNLESIVQFDFLQDIKTMIRTVCAVLGKEYK